jgi:hypothetical protein
MGLSDFLWKSARRLGAALSRKEHGDSWQDPKLHC